VSSTFAFINAVIISLIKRTRGYSLSDLASFEVTIVAVSSYRESICKSMELSSNKRTTAVPYTRRAVIPRPLRSERAVAKATS
jgi:hypothetical protein